jgi:hypothetical protein
MRYKSQHARISICVSIFLHDIYPVTLINLVQSRNHFKVFLDALIMMECGVKDEI